MSQYKVFLCHNSQDKPEVRQIRDQLRQQGIETWMDEKDIIGFDDWKKKIKENLSQINSVAVFLGRSGLGEWQKYEIIRAEEEIDRRGKEKLLPFRIGLVILPSCRQSFQQIRDKYYHTPYGWLFNYHVVDLRASSAMKQLTTKQLILAITGSQDISLLSSDCDVNYTQLRDLLRARKWKEADQETLAVMLKAAGREQEGWLHTESIKNFPCNDLHTIDYLWVEHSNRHFGFSVQKRIWYECGGRVDRQFDDEMQCNFGDHVGWRKNGSWVTHRELDFSLSAPPGHLPTLRSDVNTGGHVPTHRNAWDWGVYGYQDGVWGAWLGGGLSSLASRLVKCNI